MASTRSKTKLGTKVATAAAMRLAAAADNLIARAGDAAKRRRRARTTKTILKAAGKVALVAGTAGAAVLAGRALLRNGKPVKAAKKRTRR
ncbi:MAG: hypothetical protein HOP28_16460 [Gemmatimonadales bacterium]|nr:hypothetical protein [Gemmatimonadales bacterium]